MHVNALAPAKPAPTTIEREVVVIAPEPTIAQEVLCELIALTLRGRRRQGLLWNGDIGCATGLTTVLIEGYQR